MVNLPYIHKPATLTGLLQMKNEYTNRIPSSLQQRRNCIKCYRTFGKLMMSLPRFPLWKKVQKFHFVQIQREMIQGVTSFDYLFLLLVNVLVNQRRGHTTSLLSWKLSFRGDNTTTDSRKGDFGGPCPNVSHTIDTEFKLASVHLYSIIKMLASGYII